MAAVNSDTISLDEFLMQLGSSKDRTRLRQGLATPAQLELLDRLVTIKLVAREAGTMGLDEVPEIRRQIEVTSREILREVLIERLVSGIRPEPAKVERRFRTSVREWKTTSLLFQNDAAASRARKEIANGAAFADVASRAIAAKTAKADSDSAYHSQKDYIPQIADAIAPLGAGQVSPIIRLQAGFAIVKVVDIRYPENPDARARARRDVLKEQQIAFLQAHEQAARRKYVVINRALLRSLDYEAAKPGIDALLKDTRVVADIRGGASVTVANLTDYLRMQFFHGADQARQRNEMNAKKEAALDATIGRRLLNMEAVKLGIDKTNAYRDRVNGYRESLVFDSFVQKVIVPDNKMREEEVRTHYRTHQLEYSYPGMMKVRSLAFTGRSDAEHAVRRLREGTDYNWLAANAEGQVARGAEGVLRLDGRPLMTDSMPEGVRKALAGSKAGEVRLYASPEGHFYLLSVQEVIASNPRPYAEVKEAIAADMYNEKLKRSVAAYADKLRAHSKVATYLTRVP